MDFRKPTQLHSTPQFQGKAPENEAKKSSPSVPVPGIKSQVGGGAIRCLDENFQVNPTNGTLTLSLPIHTTQGRSGFGPSLALSYDSGNGNGLFGLGWQLSAQSISRKTSDRVPTYTENDIFVLSGADDLVPVTEPISYDSWIVERYRPRIETTALKIERWTKNHDVHWRTISSENVTTCYGSTIASRIVDKEGHIYSWLIDSSYDDKGNAISWVYKADKTQRYLKSILYGNSKPNRDISSWEVLPLTDNTWFYEVILDYGEHDKSVKEVCDWTSRLDAFSTYNCGFKVTTSRVCRRILMVHHFPEKLGEADTIVRSTVFKYQERPTGYFMESMQNFGHLGDVTEDAAPYTFTYSIPPSISNLSLQSYDINQLRTLPSDPNIQWVDLMGDGVPGLLATTEDGEWTYQRNESVADTKQFGPTAVLPLQPAIGTGHYFEDLDKNGVLDVVYVDEQGKIEGYRERRDSGWEEFTPFRHIPSQNISNQQFFRADLTGDGILDLVHIDGNNVVWQKCLGKDGFGPEIRVTGAPTFCIDDPKQGILLADMSGDGLMDFVQLSSGCITYWPNLGHGRFGQAVDMADSPSLEAGDTFTAERVRLIDINGSGLSDLLYFPPSGGVHVYYNHAGNGWSRPHILNVFPSVDNISDVFTIDLLGNGTACLCWSSPIGLSYIDLTGGVKPNLMTSFSNGLGGETIITYQPSTWYSLQAERDGKPWSTKLSFPVHCVDRTIRRDTIVGTEVETQYTYADGYYDGIERIFKGFAMVTERGTVSFGALQGDPGQTLPIVTKKWFYTGCSTSMPSIRLAWAKNQLHQAEDADTARSLRGLPARVEIYGEDRLDIPYQVIEHAYTVRTLHSPRSGCPGVFRPCTRENLTISYERHADDLRTRHELIEMNDYGDVQKSVTICYGRQKATDIPEQAKLEARYTEFEHTAVIDSPSSFYKPAVCSEKEFDLKMPSSKVLVDYEQLMSSIQTTSKVLLKETRTYYRSADLTRQLRLGAKECFSILDQTFKLATTRESALKACPTINCQETMLAGGYRDIDGDGRWWTPSDRTIFSEITSQELITARASFYQPTIRIDSFDSETVLEFDEFWLLLSKEVDPLGHTKVAINDYHHMKPITIVDANANRQLIRYDTFGDIIGVADSARADDNPFVGFQTFPGQRRLDDFLANPQREAEALIGNASVRTIYFRKRASSFPTLKVDIKRGLIESVSRPDQLEENDFIITISWLDGFGNVMQESTTSTRSVYAERWQTSGLQLNNSRGLTIKQYQACESQFPSSSALSKTILYDALYRQVGTINENHTWTKTVRTAWSTTEYDEGDTILIDDPCNDVDIGPAIALLHSASVLPTWRSRQKSESPSTEYHDSPHIKYHDCLERTVKSVEDSSKLNRTEWKSYDAVGNVTSVTDSLDRVVERTEFDYDGRATYRLSMDSGEKQTIWNCSGQPMWESNSRGVHTRTTYDALGRKLEKWVTTEQETEFLAESFTYGDKAADSSRNLRNQILCIKGQFGVDRRLGYDFKGNCTESSIQYAADYKSTIDWSTSVELDPEVHLTRTTYDLLNQPVATIDPVGNATYKIYSPAGAIESVWWKETTWQPYISKTNFNAFNNPIQIDYGNRTHTAFTYDPSNQVLLRKRTWRDSGGPLEDLHYTYDCLNQMISKHDLSKTPTYCRNSKVEARSVYRYDGLSRLVSATGREQFDSQGIKPFSSAMMKGVTVARNGNQVSEYEEKYTYDLANNILSIAHSPASGDGWTRNYTYEQPSMLETTKLGNLLSKTSIGNVSETYRYDSDAGRTGCMSFVPGIGKLTWDFADRMRSSVQQINEKGVPEITWYVYDCDGRRIRKVTERARNMSDDAKKLKETIYLPGYEIQKGYSGEGHSNLHKATVSLTGITQLARIELNLISESTLVSYQTSPELELSDVGEIISYLEHSAFGVITYAARERDIEAPSLYRYAGYERDVETGFYYCNARYYISWIGRWLSPDPAGLIDGLNLLCYVGNDPINYFDPSGLGRFGSFDDKSSTKPDPRFFRRRGRENDAAQEHDQGQSSSIDINNSVRSEPLHPDYLSLSIPSEQAAAPNGGLGSFVAPSQILPDNILDDTVVLQVEGPGQDLNNAAEEEDHEAVEEDEAAPLVARRPAVAQHGFARAVTRLNVLGEAAMAEIDRHFPPGPVRTAAAWLRDALFVSVCTSIIATKILG